VPESSYRGRGEPVRAALISHSQSAPLPSISVLPRWPATHCRKRHLAHGDVLFGDEGFESFLEKAVANTPGSIWLENDRRAGTFARSTFSSTASILADQLVITRGDRTR